MRLRTVLKVAAVVVVALIVAAVAILYSIDPNDYRDDFAAEVERATGRKLTVAGEVDLELGLTPAITVRDVGFANAPWGSRPDMVRLRRFSVEVELMSLLEDALRIKQVRISGLDLLFETDAEGRGNWLFDATGDAAPKAASDEATEVGGFGRMPEFGQILVDDVTVAYRDGVSGQVTTVRVRNLTAASAAGGLRMAVVAALNDQPVKLDATFEMTDDDRVLIKDLRLGAGAAILDGEAEVALGGIRPKITAKLESSRIDVAEFMAPASATGAAEPKPAQNGGDRLFSDDPLPLEGLKSVDIDLDLRIAKLIAGGAVLENVALTAELFDGRLTLAPFSAGLAGGDLRGKLVLNGSKSPAALSARFSASRVAIGELLRQMAVTDMVSVAGDFSLSLRGRGGSVRGLMAGLNGDAELITGQGTIKGRFTDWIAPDLVAELLPWAGQQADTVLNCFVARFDIQNGVAHANGLLLDTPQVTVQGTGDANLGKERLDFILRPRPKEQSLVSLAVPIKVGGTFADPDVGAEAAAVVAGVAGAVIGGAINQLGGLIPLVSGGSEDKNPCLAALHGAAAGATSAGGAAKSGGKTDEDGIKGILNRLGGTLDKLLGTSGSNDKSGTSDEDASN